MIINRRQSNPIQIGDLTNGNKNPILVQSMCSTKTENVEETIKEIHDLELLGCDIIRVNVYNSSSVEALPKIKEAIQIPLVADVLFDLDLILKAIKSGVDKIRINPGKFNPADLEKVVYEANSLNIPIRVGINSGSLPTEIHDKYGISTKALIEAALQEIDLLEKLNFTNIVVSLKSTDLLSTIEANQEIAQRYRYPIHLGVTQAGTVKTGLIKSGAGLGYLLINGIGDTLRISMGDDPEAEVLAGQALLRSLGLRQGPVVIAGYSSRSDIPVKKIARKIERALAKDQRNLKICILGSLVEEDEVKVADYGVVGDGLYGLIYEKGLVVDRVPIEKIVSTLLKFIFA